jgi:F-type H+-transporting ATPase subunit b
VLIDWFTVCAQAVNFLIRVGLLKHFLYRPVLDAIDAREKRIAGQIADAKQTMTEAHKEKDEFKQKNDTFDAEHAALLKKATEGADAEGKRLIDAARAAADGLAARRRDALKTDEESLDDAIRRRTSDAVFAVARKALADLADASLEDSIGELFIRRLKTLDADAVTQMTAALASQHRGKASVRSAFDVPEKQQVAIRKAIKDIFASDTAIEFQTAPELVGGIELIAGGQKLGWSIADYLLAMKASVDDLLEPKPAVKLAT